MAEPAGLPALAARFAQACRAAGLPVGPDRAARFARAVVTVEPDRTRRLYWCALATLVADPEHIPVLDRVFEEVFGAGPGIADDRGDPNAPQLPAGPGSAATGVPPVTGDARAPLGGTVRSGPRGGPDTGREVPAPTVASPGERLAGRDFDELSPAELRELAAAMSRFRFVTPPRRSRRTRVRAHGRTVDLRATLRAARRTAGDPARVVRRTVRERPRRLVVLCDISGSMEPYARAMLQLLYCAGGGAGAEVFTFATRLTRLTAALRLRDPAAALTRAGALAPDWSGGTRIGDALARFLDEHGARGMARGAVVMIVSDGWETGDPQRLGAQMARLSRLAYRVVWVNPRTRDPDYRPLAGGMAAAWPHCDAVVSAHRLDALDELFTALADRGRQAVHPGAGGTRARRNSTGGNRGGGPGAGHRGRAAGAARES